METEQTTEVRKAHNEALFRDANESVRAAQADLGLHDGRPMPFICECDDPQCKTIVRVTQEDYDAIRAHARRFLVASGHEGDGDLVAKHRDYDVVEKSGIAGEIAEATNPRKERG
jgi:hypothetical protein